MFGMTDDERRLLLTMAESIALLLSGETRPDQAQRLGKELREAANAVASKRPPKSAGHDPHWKTIF